MSDQKPPPKPPRSLDALEFELTDFDSAREALDELPAGVAEVKHLMPGYWDQQRGKVQPSDRALTGASMDWVVSLPADLRPHATCEHFPRVANAISAAWADTAYSLQVLDHVINDYRGGRRGFPPAVQLELRALYQYQRGRAGD